MTKARNRTVDDARIARTRLGVIEAEFFKRADAKVLDYDVTTFNQVKEYFLATRVFQINFNALLVAMQAHEIGGFTAGQGRAPGARDVAGAEGFKLDDVCAIIGEHGGAEWSGERVGEVEYLDAFEG